MIVKFQNIVIYHNITVSEEFEILLTNIFYIDSQLFLKLKDNSTFPFYFHTSWKSLPDCAFDVTDET